jgi:hypothetical protein
MKNKSIIKTENNKSTKQVMTRKQAISKAGLMTLTATSMLLLMKTPASASSSLPANPPVWP